MEKAELEETSLQNKKAQVRSAHNSNDNFRKRLRVLADVFRTSWLLLAVGVNNVKQHELYEEWGYKGFEDYVKSELGLSMRCVYELRQALKFIEIRRPQLKRTVEMYLRNEMKQNFTVPPLKSVLMLDRLKKHLEPETFIDLVNMVFNGEVNFPTLQKMRERDPNQQLVRLVKQLEEIINTKFLVSNDDKHTVSEEFKKAIGRLWKFCNGG